MQRTEYVPTLVEDLRKAMVAAWSGGHFTRVVALAAQAPAAAMHDETVLTLLGLAQQQQGRHTEAAATFTQLCRLRPEVSEYWNNRGVAARDAGQFADAARAFDRARALAPRDAQVAYNLGLLYIQQQRWAAAREVLLGAVELAPGFVEARLEAAHACHVCGNIEGEEAMLEGAVDWPPQPAAQALVLASILSTLGKLDLALHVLTQARLPAGNAGEAMQLRVTAQRVALYERNNQLGAARRELARAPLEALDVLPAGDLDARLDVWRAHAVIAMRERRHAEAAALYQRVLAVADAPEVVAEAAFGLASARDREGQYDVAWQALATAHAMQLRVVQQAAPELPADGEDQPLPMVTRVVDAAARAAWKPLPVQTTPPDPVFVIGFPRSGTTLLEQMLDAHPAFRSMDERGYIYQLIERMEHAGQRYPADLADLTPADARQLRAVYWRLVGRTLPNLGARRLIDKNPLNMLCLPLILRLFPAAPIILCLRHPCDVLLSCSMQAFRAPAFRAMCASLPRLARGYSEAFAQCCGHLEVFQPRVLEWRYETVVDAFGAAADRLAGFLGVADAAPFAEFAEHARAKQFIATPSYAQVVRPISRTAVGRWQHYREYFQPVLPTLRPWLERFGYKV